MFESGVLPLLLLWGVWLLIPIVTDGIVSLYHFLFALVGLRRHDLPPLPDDDLPMVSVIIPAHNEELNIDRTLLSLRAQTYPHHRLEIVVVDDGSDDRTVDRVLRHMGDWTPVELGLRTSSFTVALPAFGGVINILRRKRGAVPLHGKAAAVNAALDQVSGEIIVAIDSDVVLEPAAIENAVRQFLADEQLIAATGHLIVDPYLVIETDDRGLPVKDSSGLPRSRRLNWLEQVLTACQFLEYATAFHLGRFTESRTDSMFTMAGACAVFRREAFARAGKYRGRTVSEDADLTLALHRTNARIGYLSQMRVHLAPVISLSALYSQRTRWQRGQLEVIAIHNSASLPHGGKRFFWRLALPLRLQTDHTIAMPRLVWTFLIFMLPVFGYPRSVVAQAILLLLMFYTGLNTARVLVAYLFSSPPEKVLIRRYLGYIPLLAPYSMFLFWMRMAALLRTLTEDPQWSIENPLLSSLENGSLRQKFARAVGSFFSLFS